MKEFMRLLLVASILVLIAVPGRGEERLSAGMSEESVIGVLGEPVGRIEISGWEVLLFEEGKVLMDGGVVKALDLLSAEELEKKEQRRQRLEETQTRIRKEEEQRRQEGEQLKMEKLGDPDFLAQPLEAQIRYWEFFSQRYQEVDLKGLLRGLRNELAEKRAEEALSDEVARVEYPERRTGSYYWPMDYFSWDGIHRYGVGRVFPYRGQPAIREFKDVSLFSPNLEGLPGGASLKKDGRH